VGAAARRRLAEEMGFDCPLEPAFSFLYRADLDGGMIEHEYDHVFLGIHEARPQPDPAEVDAWRWVPYAELERELARTPEAFTYWFRVAFDALRERGWTPAGPP
jgi:isopentenyl-diphosphate delta-isomerase